MAQVITAQAGLLALLKTWYTDEEFQNLLFRNSPTLKRLSKIMIGGKEYRFAALASRSGGSTSADATVALANTGAPTNVEFVVTVGHLFSIFNVSQLVVASALANPTRASYITPLTNYAFAATEGLRKVTAAQLFGSGYSEIGQVGTYPGAALTTIVGSNTTYFSTDMIVKLDIGSVFSVTNSGVSTLPSATLRTSVNTVTSIGSAVQGSNFYPVVFTATAIETWTTTDWVCLAGGRDISNYPNGFTGLAGWLPAYYNRTGTNWNTYIGTTFFNVNRSIAPDRLAGNYYLRNVGGSEKYIDAIVEGIRLARRGGGQPDMIIVNDLTYKTVLQEANVQTQFMQMVQTDNKKQTNHVTKGLSDIDFTFSSTYLPSVIDDPYCPLNLCYILDSRVVQFLALTETSNILQDGIPDNEPGRPDANAGANVPKIDDESFKFFSDNWINVAPATMGTDGPAMQVTLSEFAQFIIRNPANCSVVQFN